jgi:4-alpha-glucanotransferase
MSSTPIDPQMAALAEEANVVIGWQDVEGLPQRVQVDTLRTVLAAFGVPADTEADIRDSRERLRAARESDRLPPLFTVEVGGRIAVRSAPHDRSWRITGSYGHDLHDAEGSLPAGKGGLTAPDRPGYYTLTLGSEQVTVAVAPRRAFGVADLTRGRPRPWGIGVQMGSLRRDGGGGLGDFTALAQMAVAAQGQGADAMAISPVHAMFAAAPERYSPYAPSSRLFLNALHVDPAVACGPDVWQSLIAKHDLSSEMAALEAENLIDWPRAARVRNTLLRSVFDWAVTDADSIQALEAFRRAEGEPLERHARFEALQAHFHREGRPGGWQAWPQAFHDPSSPAVGAFARDNEREVAFHAFCQYLARRGLNDAQRAAIDAGMSIGLIADLAVGTDGGGSQAWSHQREMIHGLSVGAPPDALNRLGQDWGLTTFSPLALQSEGFAGFIGLLRAALRSAGGVRIDHVLGLRRLWMVPHGAAPTDGAYVRYPLEDMLRLVALESHLHRAIVIGEDLGTVPSDFRSRIAGTGVMGIRVLWFERAADGGFIAPSNWSESAVATTGTHDVATVSGWWGGNDIHQRELAGLGHPVNDERAQRARERSALWRSMCASGAAQDEWAPPPPEDTWPVAIAAAAHVSRAPAPLAMLPIEDILALPDQPNLPGPTDATHPNWRRRLPGDAAALFAEPIAQATCAAAARSRQGT